MVEVRLLDISYADMRGPKRCSPLYDLLKTRRLPY